MHRIGVAAAMALASMAAAQDVPPQETGTPEVTSRMVSGQLEVRDVRNGLAIVVPKQQFIAEFPAEIHTDVQLRSQPTGCDLVVTAQNTSGHPATMGHFHVGIINLGDNIESFDFRATSDPQPLSWSTYVGPAWVYPTDLYSPVFVLRNSNYAVGVSIQYPIMDYKHDVVLLLARGMGSWMEGEGGRGWFGDFWLGHPENRMVQRWAELAPGETRTYVVSVRVSRQPDQWQSTLLPYRDYFRAHYGGVKYVRETAPIRALGLADSSYLSSDDPYGFVPWLRPDLNGWGPVKNNIMTELSGWDTVILWAASGLYRVNRDRNYPFQFTSHWDATPQLATVFDQHTGLPSLAAAGRKFGLWWGRSNEVATTWDTDQWEPFDPDNPSHVTAALTEMDGAARSGATVIGLDTFSHDLTPIWKAYPWIQELEQRYPQMKFCTETSNCDIMHTICPTFVPGWQYFASAPPRGANLLLINHPNYLVDFINPGAETWGQLSYQEQRRWFGTTPTDAQMLSDINTFAANGYRVVVCDRRTAPQGARAAQTWESDMPAAIRDADPYIANIRAGRLPGQNAPDGGGNDPNGGGSQPPAGGGGGSQPPSGGGGSQPSGGGSQPPAGGGSQPSGGGGSQPSGGDPNAPSGGGSGESSGPIIVPGSMRRSQGGSNNRSPISGLFRMRRPSVITAPPQQPSGQQPSGQGSSGPQQPRGGTAAGPGAASVRYYMHLPQMRIAPASRRQGIFQHYILLNSDQDQQNGN